MSRLSGVLAALLALALVASWALWRHAAAAEARAREHARQADEARARAERLLVEQRTSQARLERLVADQAGLRAQLERARRALRGARVTDVARIRSGVLESPSDETHPQFPPAARQRPAAPPQPQPPGADFSNCSIPALLSRDLRVSVSAARVEAESGAAVWTGEVELWASEPPPPTLLGRAPVSIDLSRWLRAPRPVRRHRLVWAGAGLGADGWAVGAGVIWPRVRSRWLPIRPSAAAVLDARGRATVLIGAAWRW